MEKPLFRIKTVAFKLTDCTVSGGNTYYTISNAKPFFTIAVGGAPDSHKSAGIGDSDTAPDKRTSRDCKHQIISNPAASNLNSEGTVFFLKFIDESIFSRGEEKIYIDQPQNYMAAVICELNSKE